MDINNPVVVLCIEDSRAELEGRRAHAYAIYAQAWDVARNDYEACIAAHYVARSATDPQEIFRWNREALDRAEAVNDERVGKPISNTVILSSPRRFGRAITASHLPTVC